MFYLAYGSNLCTGRLRRRVPSARPLFVTKLDGHKLKFHKRSVDGTGKADAFETGQQADVVWGVLFDLDEKDKTALDDAEGLGEGYAEKTVVLRDCGEREYAASTYVAETGSGVF